MSAVQSTIRVAHQARYRGRSRRGRLGGVQALRMVPAVGLGTLSLLLLLLRGWPMLRLAWSAGDYTVFYRAALALSQGHDPYASPDYHSIPAFALALRPFTVLTRDTGYLVWVAMLAGACALATVMLASCYGRTALLALIALSPAVLLALLTGQPVPLLLLGLAGALYAARNDRAGLAGACLAIAWLKPQIALPAALIFVAMRPRMALGFVLASAAVLAPPSLPAWLSDITRFAADRQSVQASPAGLWPAIFGPHHAGYLGIVLLAVGASILVQRRAGDPARALAWLVLIWFIAAPYSRPYDLVLLIVPAVVLGPVLPIILIDCWLCSALGFYGLSTVAGAAPLLLLNAARRMGIGSGQDHETPAFMPGSTSSLT